MFILSFDDNHVVTCTVKSKLLSNRFDEVSILDVDVEGKNHI